MSEVQATRFSTQADRETQELPELPMGWAWAKLSEIALEVSPGFPSGRHNQQGLGVPHLRPMNVNTNGTIELTEVKYVQETSYTPLLEGDILFNNTNSPDLVGKTAWIPRDTNWAYSNHMTRIRVDQKQFEPRWLAGYLHYLYKRGYYKLHCRNHVNQASIGTGFLSAMAIPVPPLQEQRRIVEKLEELLSDLDAGVATLRQALAKLKRYRQAVLKAAVEGELSREWREANKGKLEPASALLEHILTERRILSRAGRRYKEPTPPYADWMYELPEGWVWASVEQLGYVQLGRQRSPKHRSKDYPTPYIRAANITEKGLDLSDVLHMEFTPQERETYRLLPGDIVVAEASGSPDQVGKPALWRGEIEGCCFQNTVIRLRPVVIDSRYLLTVLKAYYTTGVFMLLAGGVGINHLSAGKFARLPVPIAPVEEQAFIISEVERRLSEADRLEATLQANLKRAERLRQAILKKAFSGELVPQNPEDEPASALLERIRASRAQTPKKGKRKQ